MKPERFLLRTAGLVQKKPWVVILAVLLLTVLSGVALRNIAFETDAMAFLPENDVVRANDRMEEHFGRDAYIHIVEVKSIEPGEVLSPEALREQYEMVVAMESVEGVVGTQSVAGIIDEMCRYIFPTGIGQSFGYNESRNIMNTPLPEIQGRINLLRSLMDGELDPEQFSQGDIVLDPAAIRFSFGLLVSGDFDLETFTADRTLILVELDGSYSRGDLRDIVGGVKSSISPLTLEHTEEGQTSEYYIAHEMETNIRPTMALLGVAIVAVITLVLVGSFRHLSYVWAPMLTLLIAIAWTFATMTVLGFVFSFLEIAVIPLIVGLGVDYSVHISKRYQEGLAEGNDIGESMENSIVKVGGALFLAFITTVIAFLSNFVSDIGPIRSFGLMCAIGITYAYLLAITFYPSIRIIVDRKRGGIASSPKPTPRINSAMKRVSNLVEEYPGAIAVLAVVLVVGSLYASTFVPVEFNLEAFLPEDWESIRTSHGIRENFDVGAFSTVFVFVEANRGEDLASPSFLHDIHNVRDNMMDDTFVVKIEDTKTGNYTYFIDSIADMTTTAVKNNLSISTMYNIDPETGKPLPNCTGEDVRGLFQYLSTSHEIYDSLRGLSYADKFADMMYYDPATGMYTASVIRQQVTSKSDAETRIIYTEAQEAVEGFGSGGVSVTGGVILTQTVLDTLSTSQVSSTVISTVLALIVLILVYRSFVLGVVSITPVVVAMSLSLGTMWVLNISLNALTIMISALTIGLGVDYAVHVVERFREEEKVGSPSATLHRTLEHTGAALLISALTTILGFGILAIAGIPIFTDFGILTAVMIAYSMLSAIFVAPVILMWLARRNYRAIKNEKEEKDL